MQMWSDVARKQSHESQRIIAENKAIEKINSIQGFIYVGGYTNTDCFVRVRCLKCGCEFNRSYQRIRKGNGIVCPDCKEREREEKQEIERLEQEARRIERLMRTYRKRIESAKEKAKSDQIKIHSCPICGKPTTGKCCSSDCQRTYTNRLKEQNRRAKIRGALVDSDILLSDLYRRDKGRCHICGGACDWNDYEQRIDGTFVAGNNYPSVDHVIPLAKGGKHEWENVRLAHRICNSIKSDSISPSFNFPQES